MELDRIRGLGVGVLNVALVYVISAFSYKFRDHLRLSLDPLKCLISYYDAGSARVPALLHLLF